MANENWYDCPVCRGHGYCGNGMNTFRCKECNGQGMLIKCRVCNDPTQFSGEEEFCPTCYHQAEKLIENYRADSFDEAAQILCAKRGKCNETNQ